MYFIIFIYLAVINIYYLNKYWLIFRWWQMVVLHIYIYIFRLSFFLFFLVAKSYICWCNLILFLAVIVFYDTIDSIVIGGCAESGYILERLLRSRTIAVVNFAQNGKGKPDIVVVVRLSIKERRRELSNVGQRTFYIYRHGEPITLETYAPFPKRLFFCLYKRVLVEARTRVKSPS